MAKESLRQKQSRFALMAADLIKHANKIGYKVTLSEAYRTPEMAAIYAEQGIGIKNSLHCKRLAIDLNLFKNGKYLTSTEDYLPLGEYWESRGGSWGGRFKNRDGCHFSLEHNGVR